MTAIRRLETVCELTMGQAPEGESYNSEGVGLPLIAGAGDFGDVHPDAKKFTTSPGKVCRTGDIVLGIRATIGEKVVADREYCLGRGVAGLRAKPGLETRYLWHWLTHVSPTLASKARGATFKQVNREDIGGLAINLPSPAEQRRIAEILDKAEALRVKRRVALAQLDTLTQAIFLDMFGDPATNPKNWPTATLGDLCAEVIDCPHSTPVYASQRSPYLCVRSSDIQNGELDLSATKCVEKSEYQKRVARGKPVRRDVIYCREGARFGNAARVTDDVTLCLGQRMMLFRARADAAVGEYIWAFLLSTEGYRQATRSLDGSASPHVNIREIVTFRLPKPSLALQHDFARCIAAVDKLKAAHRALLAEMDALFASLQYRSFRGGL
jgi:type I restriction enzyme S subunit